VIASWSAGVMSRSSGSERVPRSAGLGGLTAAGERPACRAPPPRAGSAEPASTPPVSRAPPVHRAEREARPPGACRARPWSRGCERHRSSGLGLATLGRRLRPLFRRWPAGCGGLARGRARRGRRRRRDRRWFLAGLAGPARSAGGADGADTAAGGAAAGLTVESADLSMEAWGRSQEPDQDRDIGQRDGSADPQPEVTRRSPGRPVHRLEGGTFA